MDAKYKRLRVSMLDAELVYAINFLMRQLSKRFRDRSEEDFKNVLCRRNNFVIGAFENNALIGMASMHFTDDLFEVTAAIKNVVMDKHWRGRGISRKIHDILLKEAKRKNAKFIELTSRDERVEALAFYKNIGYEENRKRHYFRLYL